jgi:signal transduction histidine kinase
VPSNQPPDLPSIIPPPLATVRASDAVPDSLQYLAERVATQLRGLVGSIDGYTDLLAETLHTGEQRELSLRILEGTAQIGRLADQLTRYSMPIRPVVRPTRISALTERLHNAVGVTDWERIVVQRSAAAGANVLADPVLLQQALCALLQNAIDGSAGQPVHLSLSVDAAPQPARFEVWNAGVIADEHMSSRIFEPFFSTKHGALGMGLPMARRIAEAHGGALHLVHSSDEDGTRFAMTLPSHPADQDAPDSLRAEDLYE